MPHRLSLETDTSALISRVMRSPRSLLSPSAPVTPGAPYMRTVPLPDVISDIAQAGLPPSGHYGHQTPSDSLALFANHTHPATMYISQIVGMPKQLVWDVSTPPENAATCGVLVTPQVLASEATYPHMPCITLHIRLRSEHRLTITSPIPGGYVTVEDVLRGVYIFLQQPIPKQVLLDMSQLMRQSVQRANQRRCQALTADQDSYTFDQEMRKGLKNVDILLDKTSWGGLDVVGPGEVILYLG